MRKKGMAFLIGVMVSLWAGMASAEKKIFTLDYIIYGKHVPHFVSLDQGFFKAEGLDVEVIRGNGSGEAIKRVFAGGAHFGHADAGTLVQSRVKGAKVKLVGMLHHKGLLGVVSLKEAGIERPKDLEGKTFGGPAGSASWLMFPVFARVAGIDPGKVKNIVMDAGSRLPSVIAGKIDAATTFATELPAYQKGARERGKEARFLYYSDYGLDIYNNGLIVSEETLAAAPDEVARFVRASYRGIAWTLEHPEEALKSFMRLQPALNPEIVREELRIFNDHLFDGLSEKEGVGVIDQAKMQRTIDIVAEVFKEKEKPSLDEVFTNDFVKGLPKTYLFPRRTAF